MWRPHLARLVMQVSVGPGSPVSLPCPPQVLGDLHRLVHKPPSEPFTSIPSWDTPAPGSALPHLHPRSCCPPAGHCIAPETLFSVGPVRAQSHGSPRAASGSPFGLGIPPSHSLCAFISRPQAPEGKDYFAHIHVAPSQSQEFVKKKGKAGKEITCMSYTSWASENGSHILVLLVPCPLQVMQKQAWLVLSRQGGPGPPA